MEPCIRKRQRLDRHRKLGAFHTWTAVVLAQQLSQEATRVKKSATEAFQAARGASTALRGPFWSWREFAAVKGEAASEEAQEKPPAVPCLVHTEVLLPELKEVPDAVSAAGAKVKKMSLCMSPTWWIRELSLTAVSLFPTAASGDGDAAPDACRGVVVVPGGCCAPSLPPTLIPSSTVYVLGASSAHPPTPPRP